MSILGNLFGSSNEKSQKEKATDDGGCCSMEIEEIPEDEAEAADAQPQNGAAPEASASEAPASESSGGCCGSNAAEAEPSGETASEERAPA